MRTLCHGAHIKKKTLPQEERENDIDNLTQVHHTTEKEKCQMENYEKAAAIADKLSSIKGIFVVLTARDIRQGCRSQEELDFYFRKLVIDHA